MLNRIPYQNLKISLKADLINNNWNLEKDFKITDYILTNIIYSKE